MFSRVFRVHGQLCASKPWEVIIGTITFTACVLSIGWFANINQKICGWNYQCDDLQDDVKSSDLIILTITRCLAVMYIYLQFTNLRKLGSKYLLGIAGVFTIFSSFVFSIVVINLVGSDLTGLNEALPFFLLLVDLSKASALAKFALSAQSQDEVVDNISRGMAIIGPTLTLDAIVEALVIGVGTLSGVKQLETMCCFGCLSVIANYLAFMTFYPACLALTLELSRERNHGKPTWQIYDITKVLEEDDEAKPNPVTQRVKLIMSGGLVFIHIYKRWMAALATQEIDSYPGLDLGAVPKLGESRYINPDSPLWMFYLKQATTPSVDYAVTAGLSIILMVKYIFFDKDLPFIEPMKDGKPPSTLLLNGQEQPITQSRASSFARRRCISESYQKAAREELISPIKMSNGKGEEKDINKKEESLDWQEWKQLAKEVVEQDGSKLSNQPPSASSSPKQKKKQRRAAASFTIGDSSESSGEEDSPRRMDKVTMVSKEIQTASEDQEEKTSGPPRSLEECVSILKSDTGAVELSDEEVLMLVKSKHIPAYKLETMLQDHERGVNIRRQLITKSLTNKESLNKLPFTNYDYKYVEGACCENVIGYMPVPVGVAGPLLMDGVSYQVPMATTEGCLVASTNRGCRAFMAAGGVASAVINEGMSRAPVVRFPTCMEASRAKKWLEQPENFNVMADSFATTSRFARLKKLQVVQSHRYLHIRFVATTGDAMGMNMLSKGSEKSVLALQDNFPDMEILSLSGNMCTDKKPSALNWIEGRGKSVVCEAIIPKHVVETVLKTKTSALVDLNISKNLVGSAMAGSIGGFNAHAANIVTAIYIATGQDPAQNVCSSMCMTMMEGTGENGEDLYISCTMPSLELGTVGGGTVLPPQAAALEMLGVRGASKAVPGENASRLARIVCSTVMAGELSLMSALAAGHLVRSHLKHNRSSVNVNLTQSPKPSFLPLTSTPKPVPGTCIQKAP